MRRFDEETEEKLYMVRQEIAEMNARFERRSELFDSITPILAGLEEEDLKLVLRIVKALERREKA